MRYEQAFESGASRATLSRARMKVFFSEPAYMDFSELEYTADGAPKLHEYYNLAWVPASKTSSSNLSERPASGPSNFNLPDSPALDSSCLPDAIPEELAVSSSVVASVSGCGPFDEGLLSRAEVFSARGAGKAYEHTSNFEEDGQPLPFPDLLAW
jgi:hypothetical protein